jgi:alpha-D-ribose 1-methylphosphonate 5-triphosphate synthase subunit PhnG
MATEHAVSSSPVGQQAVRREAMAVLATSDTEELDKLLADAGELPAYEELRKPETGLLMLRGRISGDGAPFNVGEITVTRAAVRLASSERGFGYVLGRDHDKARLMALCDALIQTERYRSVIESRVIAPIRAKQRAARTLAAKRTAATRVEFFTLVRGEDAAP